MLQELLTGVKTVVTETFQRATAGYTQNEVSAILGGDITPIIRKRYVNNRFDEVGLEATIGLRPDCTGLTHLWAMRNAIGVEADRLKESMEGKQFDNELADYVRRRAQIFGLTPN